MNRVQIDIWSDIACPWCYVGKRKLEAALSKFEAAEQVDIAWRAFELNPASPKEVDLDASPYVDRLAAKYQMPVPRAQQMVDTMTGAGAELGIDFRFDRVRPANTFDAHRAIHLARETNLGSEMKERLLRAYMTEGELISDHPTLVRLGVEVGLDERSIVNMLSSASLADEVRSEEAQAKAMGCRGVPFFVFGKEYGVQGAQPVDTLLKVLERVVSERAPAVHEGPVCSPSGCE